MEEGNAFFKLNINNVSAACEIKPGFCRLSGKRKLESTLTFPEHLL